MSKGMQTEDQLVSFELIEKVPTAVL